MLLIACTGSVSGPSLTPPSPPTPVTPVTPEPPETGTPFVPPTPTPEASETPFPFPSRLPPTVPVYGAIALEVTTLDGVDVLQGPSTITMTWAVQGIDENVQLIPQNPQTGDFRMVLPPGETYELTEFELNDPAFGFESAGLVPYGPTGGGPRFLVPSEGCLYLGLMTFLYTKLPPGDTLEQLSLAQEIARGQSLAILFTGAGTFVYLPDDPASHRFELPPAKRRPREARGCDAHAPAFAS